MLLIIFSITITTTTATKNYMFKIVLSDGLIYDKDIFGILIIKDLPALLKY